MVMNCSDYQNTIRAAIAADAMLDAGTRRHLAGCDDCREDYSDWALERALMAEWVPPPREGFVDQALEVAVRGAWWTDTRGVAIAACIAVLGIALGLTLGLRIGGERGDIAAPLVALAVDEGKTIRLLIDSPSAQQAATVTIELADNLELAGFPNERRIEWQTTLSQGRNLLALPLRLTGTSDSQFRVNVVYGDTHKDIQVSVKALPGQVKA